MHNAITDIEGIQVGHWTDERAATGCTVVLCGEEGGVAGVDVRGGAPGTREIALLDPTRLVQRVHAVCLSGGSAFGLAAADGVMRYLEEQGIGFETDVARVPIVPAAIIFDLALGDSAVRPDAAAGYAACAAATGGPVAEGSVGAGTGATVGKLRGMAGAMKGGLGTASCRVSGGAVVGALAVVNSFGDVVDAEGKILAGTRLADGKGFMDTEATLLGRPPGKPDPLGHTTLAVVATDVTLTKAQATKLAQMAHDGLARAIRPVHTPFDGDTVFALSLGNREGDVGRVGVAAVRVVAEAVVRAARKARGLHGVPGMAELF